MSYDLTEAIKQVVLNAIAHTYQGFSDAVVYGRNPGHINKEVVDYLSKDVLEKLAEASHNLAGTYPNIYVPFSEDKWLNIFRNHWEEFIRWRKHFNKFMYKSILVQIVTNTISGLAERMDNAAEAGQI